MYIENINGPQDVKKLTVDEMRTLADEMRHALLIRASKHGGHFGPNFGMVEATIALHYVFESPKHTICLIFVTSLYFLSIVYYFNMNCGNIAFLWLAIVIFYSIYRFNLCLYIMQKNRDSGHKL